MKNDRLNIKEQCELLEINRTSMYYQPVEPAEKKPWSVRNTSNHVLTTGTQNSTLVIGKSKKKLVQEDGIAIGRKLVRTLYGEMNICRFIRNPIFQSPEKNSLKFPYLLKNLKID